MTYAQQNLGTSLSDIVTFDDTQDEAIRSFERGAVVPTIKPPGLLWWCQDATTLTAAGAPAGATEALVRWTGAAWVFIALPGALLSAGGQVPLSADLNFNAHKGTNVLAGANPGDLIRLDQACLRAGGAGAAWTGNQDAGTKELVNLGAPTTANSALRKGDVQVVPFPCSHWYQTNYDTLGNGKPIVIRQEANQPGTFTDVGRVPRRLRLRLTGNFRQQDDNSDWGAMEVDGLELDIWRWNGVAAGGDAGNDAGEFLLTTLNHPSTPRRVFVYLQWKFAEGPVGYVGPMGFYLKFLGGGAGFPTPWLTLRKIGTPASNGVIQGQAFYGEGT